MNILDYIDWRGDITFEQKGLNEVDNLIFSSLAYLDMGGIVAENGENEPTLAEIYDAYIEAGYDQSYLINNPAPLIKKAAKAERFKNIRAKWYINVINSDKQIQFAAVSFLLGSEIYIAFRGTDNTIVGWREDCNMSFLSGTPGQSSAAKYVNLIAERTYGPLIVGGHSKGGNFAVYGSAFCNDDVKDRIIRVYSNDGPGFNKEIADTKNYTDVLKKTIKIIPGTSLVGLLLTSKANRKVIKSSGKGALQHNPFTWEVIRTGFVPSELTESSILLDDTLTKWIENLSDDDKQILVNSVFDSVEATGATTLNEIIDNKRLAYNAILNAVVRIDTERKTELKNTLRKLIESGKEAVKNETIKKVEKIKLPMTKELP